MHKVALFLALVALAVPAVAADSLTGTYLETRTCQVYTGPCFANAEMALGGKEAVMAWNIESGKQNAVDLSGLSVVMVLAGNETLGFRGIDDPQELKSAIIVDAKATAKQREALIAFAKERIASFKVPREIRCVETLPRNALGKVQKHLLPR